MKLPKAVAIVGPSKSGKTTLIKKLVKLAKSKGFKVATVKHAPNKIDIDRPDSDSDLMFKAGADMVALVSRSETVLRVREKFDPDSILKFLYGYDLIIFEGFKKSKLPKIEIVPQDKAPLTSRIKNLIARVTSSKYPGSPSFTANQVEEILQFILKELSH